MVEKSMTPPSVFTAADFDNTYFSYGGQVKAAEIANAKLAERSQVVYGSPAHGMQSPGPIAWDHAKRMTDTHRALLIAVQPIERKRESAEDVLNAILAFEREMGGDSTPRWGAIIERARKVLGAE